MKSTQKRCQRDQSDQTVGQDLYVEPANAVQHDFNYQDNLQDRVRFAQRARVYRYRPLRPVQYEETTNNA